jgi:hypothetical protein
MSIQMAGLEIHEDTGTRASLSFWDWRLATSSFLDGSMATESTRTGQPAAATRDVGGGFPTLFVTRGQDQDEYPSLQLNSFNIAVRYVNYQDTVLASQEILGTPAGGCNYPDLTSYDMQLALNFNGFISLFRMWNADIGNTGIEEASS